MFLKMMKEKVGNDEYFNKNIEVKEHIIPRPCSIPEALESDYSLIRVKNVFRNDLKNIYNQLLKEMVKRVKNETIGLDEKEYLEYMSNQFKRNGYVSVGTNLWRLQDNIKKISKRDLDFKSLYHILCDINNYEEYLNIKVKKPYNN